MLERRFLISQFKHENMPFRNKILDFDEQQTVAHSSAVGSNFT